MTVTSPLPLSPLSLECFTCKIYSVTLVLAMGQAVSKATSAVKRAAATTRLSQQQQQAQRTRSAAEAEWKKSSAAPSTHNHSSQEYAPTRGQSSTTTAINTTPNDDIDTSQMEMPPDLIKFLNDAGPLQRTLDKDRTSSKVYDSLLSNENERQEQAKQANTRVRKKMPIISAVKDTTNGDDDGTMVERSTNFSTTDRTSRLLDETTRFGVTREDLYNINEKLKGVTNVDSDEWKKIIQDEYFKDDAKSKSDDQLKDLIPFENCMRYIGVPVIMKDNEGDIIGVWPSLVEDVKHSSGLKPVSEMNVGFIYKNEK